MEDLKLKFEKFTETGGKFSYKISLNKSGGFSFSSGFCRKHNIKKERYPYVLLFYSKKPLAVGFSFLKEATKGAFKISFSDSNTASVSPNSFMAAYELKPETYSEKYDPRQYRGEEGENIFYINLEQKK